VKVLVTGASGFLGRALVERLLARGHDDLRCLVRSTSRRDPLEASAARHPGARVEIVEGSLATVQAAGAVVEGVALVFHLVAGMRGSRDDVWRDTVLTSRNLLDAMAVAGCIRKVVLVSSIAVYEAGALPRGSLIDEDTAVGTSPQNRDPYSGAKIEQERIFRAAHDTGAFDLAVARPGVIYGPGGPLLSNRLGLMVGGFFLALGGSNPLPLTFVDNCAEAIALIGERSEASGKTYNVVDDDAPTCAEYLRRYRRHVEPAMPAPIPIPYPLLAALATTAERLPRGWPWQIPRGATVRRLWGGHHFTNARLKAFGWRPLVSTKEGLERTIGGPT
jgi:nucleoside-diphosphate-sugar epimerase